MFLKGDFMQNDNVENNNINNYEEIIIELEQCREDERNSQNQILQVIGTVGTVLTLIFGVSSFVEHFSFLFHLSNFALCATFGYITSLGISAVLRYHYIRNLEDKLLKENEKDNIVHWNCFASSITTRNPKHINNIYTRIHYLSYSIAAICPIIFCVVITFYQYFLIENKNIIDNLGIVFLSFFLLLCLVFYFIISINARLIYEKALEISVREQNKRIKKKIILNLNKFEDKNNEIGTMDILKALGYFIYPKKKDLQKLFLLIIGFLTGTFLKNNTYQLNIYELKNMFLVCLIIDFLLYQARYQWNDIRGVKEDIAAGKTDRLPVKILGKYPSIIISSVILLIKVIVALLIAVHIENDMRVALFVSSIIIIFCAFVYEFVRSKKNEFWTFVFVSFGYGIRFCVGIWSAYPNIWSEGLGLYGIKLSYFIIITLIISYTLLGEYSVALSWIHEALFQKSNGIQITKKHYIYLYKQLAIYCKDENSINTLSLKQGGNLYDLWTLSYIVSIFLLGLIGLIINFNFAMLILGLLTIIFSVMISTSGIKDMKWNIGILIGIYLIEFLYSVFTFNWFLLYIFVTQFMFSCIYLFLRFLFKPDFDFVIYCKNILIKFFIIFIGKEAYSFLDYESDNEET